MPKTTTSSTPPTPPIAANLLQPAFQQALPSLLTHPSAIDLKTSDKK